MKLYPIFSKRLAYQLERIGFKLITMAPNRQNLELQVYYFEDTVELHHAVQKLIQKK